MLSSGPFDSVCRLTGAYNLLSKGSVTHDRERNRDDLKRLDYCLAVTNACAMLPLSSNQLMVLREQPEAMPA